MTQQSPIEQMVAGTPPVHTFHLQTSPGGHVAGLYKRVDVHKLEQVGTVLLTGDGIRSERIVEALCRALDDELANRP